MGGQKGIVHFYQHLKQHHIIVMAASSDNETADPGYRVENILFNHRRMGLNLLRLARLRNIIQSEGIDAIIAEHSYTGWIAWLLKKWTGIPFMIHSHNIEASRFKQMGKKGWKWYGGYEKWIHQKADFNFFKTEDEKLFAVREFSLLPQKCGIIPYGVSLNEKIAGAEQKFQQQYNLCNQYIFYFNGTLDYAPNQKAVERIIDSINPQLIDSGIDYTILISGKNLSSRLQHKIETTANIDYMQFVDDVELVYQASTLFLNPVINDSGIKTKVVEALANGCTVISTESGATGIPKNICSQKLIVTKDGDWKAFVAAILENLSNTQTELPSFFFSYFSWPNIAQKAARQMQETINNA